MDQSLPPEEIKQKALKKALDLLSLREHSLQELRQKLLIREFSENIIEEALSHIAERGWQSDERFSESYVNMRIQRFYGPVKIRQELLERGVSKELIDHQLSLDQDEWIGLAQMARKKHFGDAMPETFKARAKQMRFLQYRGFTTEQINRIF